MKKVSVKGDYGFERGIAGSEIRDLQGLLNSRRTQMATLASNGFGAPEHKMEFVKNIRGVDFVNDAASENVNGVYMALSNLQKQTVWITSFEQWGEAGGLFADLMYFIQTKVSSVVFVGDAQSPSRAMLEGMGVVTDCASDMESAVRTAFYSAGKDHQVLYCPGTPAENDGGTIARRGSSFKNAVAQL